MQLLNLVDDDRCEAQCVAVCYSVLQYVALCCSVEAQCVVVCYSVLQYVALC